MDKYEFNIKVEQIKKLAAKKSFKEAAAIAKEMNWQKVKDWSTLATVINVQEAAGDYLEARDMAILAYNRNLGGRKLVYKLTELLIKLEDFETAEELYEEYEKMSQHDVNRYILFYDLRKAQRASDNELVEILEDYKEHEIDEKYMFELAKLYSKTGRKEECIKTCDDIVLWFQDGVFVEKAIQLKLEFGAELTNTQKKILEETRKQKQDVEATREILFEEQKKLAAIQSDEIEEAIEEAEDISEEYDLTEDDEDSVGGIKSFFKKAFGGHSNEKSVYETEEDYEEDYDSEEEQENTEENASQDSVITPSKEETVTEPQEDNSFNEDYKITSVDSSSSNLSESIDKASVSLRELIEDAKKKLENSYDELSRQETVEIKEEPKEKPKEKVDSVLTADTSEIDIKVDIPSYNNPYDTQNLQAAIAKNLNAFLEEDKAETEALRPQPIVNTETEEEQETVEDDQIEGQLSLADWMEAVREEKYGKQNTKEFSKSELERMLDEKDEKSAAYEKIMAEQKAQAQAAGREFDEKEASRKAHIQVMLQAAKTDLAIRTGKATAKLEDAAAAVRKASADEAAATEEGKLSDTAAFKVITESDLPKEEEQAAVQEDENETVALYTAPIQKITDEMLNVNPLEAISSADLASAVKQEERQEQVQISHEPVQEQESPASFAEAMQQLEEPDEEKKLSGELAKIFRKYREMPGLESQLVDYFNALEREMSIPTSEVGNIIISGNSSSDKSDLARTIVRAINYLYPDRTRKIAKTTGDSINHRGLTKAMNKLRGTALIVEGAGSIQPKRMTEVLECLEQDTDRMIVILEDSDAEINVLLNFNPDMNRKFNHRIILKQYTVNELVEMARKFARKRQYEVDDDALLELYLKIDKLRSNTDNIRLDDVKEIINQAIVKSEKRASRKFFGGLKKKRGENGDIIFLSEADFKD